MLTPQLLTKWKSLVDAAGPVDLVVTRHEGLLDLLRMNGMVEIDVECREHVTAADVRGRNVCGILPFNLAKHAKSVFVVDIDIPASLRGVEMSARLMDDFVVDVSCYVVLDRSSLEVWP